jgi:hypothetical protein
LSFYHHMEAVGQLWTKHQNVTNSDANPTVIFTSESKAVVQEQVEFASNLTIQQTLPHKFGFVTNSEDRHPDSGFGRDAEIRHSTISADDAMLDAMSSLKLQLLPRISMGNCCSNFHILIADFLMEGCGVASDNTFKCLQENEDPRFIVCCQWHKNCPAERQELLDSRNLTLPTYN